MTEPADRPARCTAPRGGRGAGLASWWPQWLCLAAAPLVLLRDLRPTYGELGLALLAAQQAARLLDADERRRRFDLDVAWPAVGLVLLAAVAPLVSPDYTADRRQFAYLLLHFGAFTATVSSLRTARLRTGRLERLWIGLAVYLGCGVPLAIAAFLYRSRRDVMSAFEVALDEAIWKLPDDAGLLVELVLGAGRLHPQDIGGLLTLFLPLYAALLVYRPWRDPPDGGPPAAGRVPGGRGAVRWPGLAAGLALAIVGGVMAATLSRGAALAVAIGLSSLLAYRWRRVRVALAVLAAGLALLAALTLAEVARHRATGAELSPAVRDVVTPTLQFGRGESILRTLAARLVTWRHAVALIQEHPWTGIGPGAAIHPAGGRVPVDNLYLQTALDLGLPGLLLLLALLGLVLARLYRGWRRWRGTRHEVLALGPACALGTYLLWSTHDHLALGAKPTLFLWLLLGLAAGLPAARAPARPAPPGPRSP